MTTSALRQPQGIPPGGRFAPTVHTEPQFSLGEHTTAGLAALAAAETPILARRRSFLQDQIDMVETRQRAPACAAATHHVLQLHPDAAVHAGTSRYYVPQGLTGYLLGRVLDIVIVTAATFGLTKAVDALAHSTTLMAPEWNVRDVLPPTHG